MPLLNTLSKEEREAIRTVIRMVARRVLYQNVEFTWLEVEEDKYPDDSEFDNLVIKP